MNRSTPVPSPPSIGLLLFGILNMYQYIPLMGVFATWALLIQDSAQTRGVGPRASKGDREWCGPLVGGGATALLLRLSLRGGPSYSLTKRRRSSFLPPFPCRATVERWDPCVNQLAQRCARNTESAVLPVETYQRPLAKHDCICAGSRDVWNCLLWRQ